MQDLIKANLALLFAGVTSFILMGAGQSLYGPALPAFARNFDVSISSAGILISAHWVGCAIGVGVMYFYTALTPRYVLAAMVVGAALIGIAPSYAVMLLGGLVFGAGYGAATVVFNPRVLRAFGPRGPAMLSLLNASFGIGAISAPLVFVALSNDPKVTFLGFAVLIAAVWLFAFDDKKSAPQADIGAIARFKPHWPILGFQAVAIALEAVLIGLGPSALIAAGETEVRSAELLSMFFIGFLLARVGLIGVAHRISALTLVNIALGGAGVCAVLGALAMPALGFVPLGFFAGMFFPCIYVAASGTMQGHPRTAVAIIAAGLVGGIFAPIVLSPLMPMLGERGFFWLIAAVAGAMALLGSLRSAWLLAK
jgi:MFS transporter, FHS family, glucose/mannose:H+ symporter